MTTQFTIAYRCAQCGKIQFKHISIFEIHRKKSLTLQCLCGHQTLSIFTKDYKKFRITIHCLICSNTHIYYLYIREDTKTQPKILYCRNYQLELCFVGERQDVEKAVDFYEKKLENLMDELGYDNYFVNSEIMMECLDILHDLAEKHCIICDCGINHMDITLLPDSIEILCTHCKATYHISAKERKDVENLKEIKGIHIINSKSSI